MRHMKFVLFLLILFAGNSFACSCRSNLKSYDEEVTEKYNNSKIVISAKAINTERSKSDLMVQKVEWKVISSWKGNLKAGESFNTVTFVGCCLCFQSVEKNAIVIFYENDIKNLKVRSCNIGIDSKSQPEQEKILNKLRKK